MSDEPQAEAPAPPPAPVVPRGHVSRTARLLGVNRRTLYKWEARGAPIHDEAKLRTWARAEGVRLRPPIDAGLDELVVIEDADEEPGAPGEASPPVDAESASGGGAPTGEQPGTVESANALLSKQRTHLVAEQTKVAQLTRLRLERSLIDRDGVKQLVRAFGLILVAELADLPMHLVKLAPEFQADQRRALRRAGEALAEKLRERMTDDLKQRLVALLHRPAE